jgi:hypothetical protein
MHILEKAEKMIQSTTHHTSFYNFVVHEPLHTTTFHAFAFIHSQELLNYVHVNVVYTNCMRVYTCCDGPSYLVCGSIEEYL